MTIERVLELLFGQAGVIFLLLLILWSGWRGYWIFGAYHAEMMRRADERANRAEQRLDRAVNVAERGTVAADRATRVVERQLGPSGALMGDSWLAQMLRRLGRPAPTAGEGEHRHADLEAVDRRLATVEQRQAENDVRLDRLELLERQADPRGIFRDRND